MHIQHIKSTSEHRGNISWATPPLPYIHTYTIQSWHLTPYCGTEVQNPTTSTMLIHCISCLLNFHIKKRRPFTYTWRRMTYMTQYPFKVSGLAANYFLLIFFLYYFVQLIDWLLFNVNYFSCIHNKTLYIPWVFSLHKSFILTNVPSEVVSSTSVHGEVFSIQHYVIKFVSDLTQVSGFLWVLRFPEPIQSTATT